MPLTPTTGAEVVGRLGDDPPLTLLAVSSRRETLKLADVILVLDDFELVATGPLERLLNDCTVLHEIWDEV